jgi:hypothetical protein
LWPQEVLEVGPIGPYVIEAPAPIITADETADDDDDLADDHGWPARWRLRGHQVPMLGQLGPAAPEAAKASCALEIAAGVALGVVGWKLVSTIFGGAPKRA